MTLNQCPDIIRQDHSDTDFDTKSSNALQQAFAENQYPSTETKLQPLTASDKGQHWGNIPAELRERRQWVVADKNKAPYQANGQRASSKNPNTWADFDTACAYAQQHNMQIGYVLTADDPFTCIDLDVKNNTPQEHIDRIQSIIEKFESYTEYSQSGKGFHIWVKGKIGQGRRRDNVEVYSQERFIICTGNIHKDCPIIDAQSMLEIMVSQLLPTKQDSGIERIADQPQIESDESIEEKARNAGNKEKFQALWDAELDNNLEAIGQDHSKADLSLIQILAFYTPNDKQLIRLWHSSNLGKREKAKRKDYIEQTINEARLNMMSDLIKEQEHLEHGKEMAESLMTMHNNKKFNKSKLPFFMTDQDLESLPPPSWLVDDIIPETGIGVIFGESGSFKSFLTIDLLAHIGNSKVWFGNTTKQKPVLYIPLEGKSGISKRIKAWKMNNHSSDSKILSIYEQIDFADSMNIDFLIKKIKEAKLDGCVICIDTLAQAGGEMDENSSKDMGRMIKTFQRLQAELGGVVIIVHHTGKDTSKGMRGHSSLYASLDFAIECKKGTVDKQGEFCLAKSKDSDSSKAYKFNMLIVNTGYEASGKPITSLAVAPNLNKDLTTQQKEDIKIQEQVEQDNKDDNFIWQWIADRCAKGEYPSKNSLKSQLNKMKLKYDITQKRINSAVDRLLASSEVISEKHIGNSYLRAVENCPNEFRGSPNNRG